MFEWFKRRKLNLIGTSKWQINWTDTGCQEKGVWLYYQSESGRREIESSAIPWVYKGMGGETRLPGYPEALTWLRGGTLPKSFVGVKETL